MELQGKKINFLGDSITEGTGASSYETSYVSVFGRQSGAAVRNYGIGGTRTTSVCSALPSCSVNSSKTSSDVP